ncbi:hypothetical protein P8627_09390 [Jannaschia sp. GRR-S6-38]|uniref:Uncharacterized protein n=2 Tax=Jannaschia ovalis TaxID=3038773 RepID=A0ABY8LGD3_9RHOB|nr:hypothetical protein [Jannaschia sp. GRR-S6-38]WGH80359.1 hypothetical protein P8627_09390 [Jannaschia sp. GRR-S6-38]
MRLERMGAFHQCRLSFMRVLLRRLKAEGWRVTRPLFEIAADGTGRAVYTAQGPERAYSLVCFAHDLADADRSDRVIATRWDATFALHDGVPTEADLARLEANVPRQEAGRIGPGELCLSRANRSVRLFAHVVDALAAGRQPDPLRVEAVGYLMRTTAVYGSGKFGAADRARICDRPEFAAPFQPEMLTVWLIRSFVMDQVEAMAAARAPDTAVTLEPALRRRFGIGNSTGLGMAPFLVNHPALLHRWIAARETALARVLDAPVTPETIAGFEAARDRAAANVAGWQSRHPAQAEKLAGLRADMERLVAQPVESWGLLWTWAQAALSVEGQEMLVSLMMEPHGHLVDDLADGMAADEAACFAIDGAMSVADLRAIVARVHPGAPQGAPARIWFTSADKMEPRLGAACPELEPYAQPLTCARDAARLRAALAGATGAVADFLIAHPEHRHAVRRAQIAARHPYAEIRDDLAAGDLRPFDMLRAKLSFFGAGRFDPRSDRWLRIEMFRGAPYPEELPACGAEPWAGLPQ